MSRLSRARRGSRTVPYFASPEEGLGLRRGKLQAGRRQAGRLRPKGLQPEHRHPAAPAGEELPEPSGRSGRAREVPEATCCGGPIPGLELFGRGDDRLLVPAAEAELVAQHLPGIFGQAEEVRRDFGTEKLRRLDGQPGAMFLDRWYAVWQKNGSTAAEVFHTHRVLSSMLDQAEKRGYIDRSGTDLATAPSYELRATSYELRASADSRD